MGATRLVALSRNPALQALARSFGATDIVAERGDAATEAVMHMTDGVGVDYVLECVGRGQSMATALSVARPGATVGYVGVPHGVEIPVNTIFFRTICVRGGPSPVRRYIPERWPSAKPPSRRCSAYGVVKNHTQRRCSPSQSRPARRYQHDHA